MTNTLMLDKARAIDGWMDEPDLQWLAERAQEHTRIVELGCYLGRSTRALADNTEGWVLAVDNWLGSAEMKLTETQRGELFSKFVVNCGDLISSGVIKPLCCDHGAVELPTWVEPKFDMVFIDGAHDYDSVCRDIEFWRPKLTITGLLCGHDINHDAVEQAVRYAVKSYKTVIGTRIWYAV